MKQTFINGPAIAALYGLSLVAAHKRMHAGQFGPLIRRGRRVYASLAAVQIRLGRSFPPEQIAAAVGRLPERLLTIDEDTDGIAAA